MKLLLIRTDKPEAELYVFNGSSRVAEKLWRADRQLAKTILSEIQEVVSSAGIKLEDIEGVIVFSGPGSFTGLRIGITVANTLADGLNIPIVGTSGDNWQEKGIKRLTDGENDKIVTPNYGAEPNTPPQKK